MPKQTPPAFAHDCTACVYVGRAVHPHTQRPADVYVCAQNGRPTTVVRFSSDGPDYTTYETGVYGDALAQGLLIGAEIATRQGVAEGRIVRF